MAEEATIQNPVEEVITTPAPEVVETSAEITEAPAPQVEEVEEDPELARLQAAVETAETPEDKATAKAAQNKAWAKLRREARDAELGKIEAEKKAAYDRGVAEEARRRGGPPAKLAEEEIPAYVAPDFLIPKPKPEDFDYDDEKLETAKDDWMIKRAQHFAYHQIKAEEYTATAKREREAKAQQNETAQRELDNWVQKGTEKYPDFKQVLETAPALPNTIAQAAWEEDNSNEVAYYLAKNQAEMKRIAALPPNRHASEVGKLAYRLSQAEKPKPKTISNAPPPQKPLGSAETEVVPDLATADMQTYAAHHPLMKGRTG